MSTIVDFYIGNTTPLQIPGSVVDEFIRNGASIHKILDSTNEDMPGHVYLGAAGYEFEWGQIIEISTIGAPEIEGGALCSWEFCLSKMLAEYHQAGSHLSELADVGMWYLVNLENSPTFVSVGEGNTVSSFELYAFNEDIIKARQWIGEIFIPKHLPRMLEVMRNHLILPDPRIPLHEPPCRLAIGADKGLEYH